MIRKSKIAVAALVAMMAMAASAFLAAPAFVASPAFAECLESGTDANNAECGLPVPQVQALAANPSERQLYNVVRPASSIAHHSTYDPALTGGGDAIYNQMIRP